MSKAAADRFAIPRPPKRTNVSDAAAAAFTAAEARARKHAPSRRRRAELGERLGVYLPPELAKAVRVRAAEEGRSLSDAVTEALEAWLRRVGP